MVFRAYTTGVDMTEEDEAFNELERQSLWRKRAVQGVSTNPYRDQVIEEVAQHIENWKALVRTHCTALRFTSGD